MVHWKRNVGIIWLSQFLSIAGFSFGMPFAPYYFQELGVQDPGELKMWVAFFGAAAPLSLAIFSPIWGMLADRFGRRIMLLRANLGASVVLMLMSAVTGPGQLICLRLAQGVFTGTMTAAQAMVAVHAPRQRSGMAMGMLSSAVYSGAMMGAFLGGITAHMFGYRAAFMCGSSLLVMASLLVLFGTDETTVREEAPDTAMRLLPRTRGLLKHFLPFLILVLLISFVRRFDVSFVPLLVQDIHGSLEGASIWTGSLNACGGIAGFLAGLVVGRLVDRFSAARLAMLCALGAAIVMIPQGFARGFGLLFSMRFLLIFFAGGIEPILQSWLAKITPENQRGTVFGLAGTARALGWMLSSLAAGLVAGIFSVRAIFFVGSGLFAVLAILVSHSFEQQKQRDLAC